MKQFVFFGTPRFAEIFLSELISRKIFPSLVVTNPDRPAGRNKELTPPPVKLLAEKYGIPVFQPDKLKVESIKSKVEGYDFGVVAAYGLIIPKSVIELFPKGIICIHPSLLPELRGATPIQTALLENRKETGATLFLLDKFVDHGPIIAKQKLNIEESDDYISLEEKLARTSALLFSETIEKYLSGEISPHSQDEASSTLTKKFVREDAFISEEELKKAEDGKDVESVFGKIRAFSNEPGAWTIQNGKQVKLLASKIQDGKLKLTKIQIEGKKPQAK